MTETQLQSEILRALGSRPDVRLFRNMVGKGWSGRVVAETGQTVTLSPAWHVTYGLCVGSADLIGWRQVTVTPEMVGQKIAQFLSVEVKKMNGKISDEQMNWWRQVRLAGGIGIVARSVAEAKEAL